MGYYVDFELQIQNVDEVENIVESVEELCPDLIESIEYSSGVVEEEVKSGFIVFNSKWYDREGELKALTKRHPELNITLYCDGEDNERWVEYYKNGEMEIGIATLVYSKTTLW
jgi:hypothetical protein